MSEYNQNSPFLSLLSNCILIILYIHSLFMSGTEHIIRIDEFEDELTMGRVFDLPVHVILWPRKFSVLM